MHICSLHKQIFVQKHQKQSLCRAPIHAPYSTIFISWTVELKWPLPALLVIGWRAAITQQKGAVQGLCLGCHKASNLLSGWAPSGSFECNFDYPLSVLTVAEPKFQLFSKHLFCLFYHNGTTVYTLLIKLKKAITSSFLISFENLLKLFTRRSIQGDDLLSYKVVASASVFTPERRITEKSHNIRFQIKGWLEAFPISGWARTTNFHWWEKEWTESL